MYLYLYHQYDDYWIQKWSSIFSCSEAELECWTMSISSIGCGNVLWDILLTLVDSFTVPLHSPNGRHLPAVRAVQRDSHWSLKNGENSHWSCGPIMQWGTRQSQSIFSPTNHKSVTPAKKQFSQMRAPLASHREPVGAPEQAPSVLYIF